MIAKNRLIVNKCACEVYYFYMKTLKEYFIEAGESHFAIPHFNIADISMLKAIFETAQKLSQEAGRKLPLVIGASEGERDFMGVHQTVAIIKSLREENDYPIFVNADHTSSVERSKEAIDAGYDMVIIDQANKPLAENIATTKEVVAYAKSVGYRGLVEGELGYIGSGSKVLEDVPEGAAITQDAIASVAEATKYVSETGVDLFAPAVGNIHGMLAKGKNPHIFIERIKEIKDAVKIPLILHGASGIPDEDFAPAIDSGISMIHISTEIRKAWQKGLKKDLIEKPDELAPYKVYQHTIEEMKEVVEKRMRLFYKM